VYFFFASLNDDVDDHSGQIERAYEAFPWQGGFSAVNFFNQLKYATPAGLRPMVIAIQKSSPGYLDLGLWLVTARMVAGLVRTIASTIDQCNTIYNNIVRGMQERKLLRIQVRREAIKFQQEELDFIKTSSKQMASLLGFRSPSELNRRSGHPYVTLKLLLSVYRRVRTLGEYENSGKAWLNEAAIPIPSPPSRRRRKRLPPKPRSLA
jgi:hypothetical protein